MKDVTSKKKFFIMIAVAAAVILTVGVITLLVGFGGRQDTDFPDVNEGPGEEVFEKSLVFYDRYILTAAYNIDFSAVVLDDIQAVVFSDEEMAFSKNNSPAEGEPEIYYDAIIDVGNFSAYDAYTSKFEVAISDERKYQVLTQTDSLDEDFTYVYMAILRNGGDKVFVVVNGDEKDKEAFVDLVKEKMGKTLVETFLVKSLGDL